MTMLCCAAATLAAAAAARGAALIYRYQEIYGFPGLPLYFRGQFDDTVVLAATKERS